MDTQAGAEGGGGGGDFDAAAAEAAANHPSPLVAATYWGSSGGGYAPRGRGFARGGRAGGFAARGRGGGRTYFRAQVQNLLASKTWVRKKDGENDGGGGGGDAAGQGQGGGDGPAEWPGKRVVSRSPDEDSVPYVLRVRTVIKHQMWRTMKSSKMKWTANENKKRKK
jgi:hypothetical protein